jgi:hypothetical protein
LDDDDIQQCSVADGNNYDEDYTQLVTPGQCNDGDEQRTLTHDEQGRGG